MPQIVIVTRLQQGSSLCNMLLRGMKDDSGKANEQDSDVFHHDEGRKRQDDFSVDVRNLVDALRSRGNPFLEAGLDLVNWMEESATQRMYRRSMIKARISTINLSMTLLSPGILLWTRQLRITRFSSSKSQSDARRSNRMFLY